MTLVEASYRKTSARHTVDGVTFQSYSVGISRYARISEDGRVMTTSNSRMTTYSAFVEGHGYILGASGKPKRFRNQEAAMKAAVKLARSL